jgi:hypothetical protein
VAGSVAIGVRCLEPVTAPIVIALVLLIAKPCMECESSLLCRSLQGQLFKVQSLFSSPSWVAQYHPCHVQMGMGFGILLSKRNPSLLATFGVLSCGYLLSSYNECRSIQLPTLNRARFSVAVRTFLESGKLGGVAFCVFRGICLCC